MDEWERERERTHKICRNLSINHVLLNLLHKACKKVATVLYIANCLSDTGTRNALKVNAHIDRTAGSLAKTGLTLEGNNFFT